MSNFVKPQSPIYNKSTDTYIYPLTTSDQVIMPDGTRLDAENIGGVKMELLWENGSPTSAFAAQSVSLNLDEGDLIYVVPILSNHYNPYSIFPGTFCKVGEQAYISTAFSQNFIRAYKVTVNGINFGEALVIESYASATVINNGCAIPARIYRIKGVN